MTNRLFLTLLALLTGLVTPAASVHARIAPVSGAEANAVIHVVADRVSGAIRHVAVSGQPAQRQRTAAVTVSAVLFAPLRIPAVLTRIDRARE